MPKHPGKTHNGKKPTGKAAKAVKLAGARAKKSKKVKKGRA